MDRLIALAIGLGALACNAPGEDVPPTSTTTSAPSSTTSAPAPCTVSTPLELRNPDCYLTWEGVFTPAPNGLPLNEQLAIDAQELINTARNFLRVVFWDCDTEAEPYGVSHEELVAHAERMIIGYYGRRTEAEVRTRGPEHPSYITWQERMVRHRKCTPGEESRWCGRTAIYRPVWEPWFANWGELLSKSREFDGRGVSLGFDGIRAACRAQQ